MPRGSMNPDTAAKSAGGTFKEGFVRIDSNSYKVHKSIGEDAVPATKWSWQVTRLAEDGETPLLDEHDEQIREEILFSFGGKCLPFVHPGKADGPLDEDPEDLGTGIDIEGNTIYLNASDWAPNEKSAVMVLTRSMVKQSIKAEYLNRCWCPDWVGCVFEMKSQMGEKGRDGREFSYKVVTRVMVPPGSKKGAVKAGPVNGKVAANLADHIAPILKAISEEMDGQQMTQKAFLNRVRTGLEGAHLDSKLLVPTLALAKDPKWLAEHADTFNYTLYPEDQTIVFGTLIEY